MRITFIFSLVFLAVSLPAQITDAKGQKQGYWKKKDASNKLVYEGEFKNDKPVGTFKYYYPNDSVKAILDFRSEGKIAYAKLFHLNGKRMAQGKYVNKETRDSTWLFYDEAGVLISRDNYKMGKKEGTCYVYFPDGKTSEEKNYRNDVLHGEFKEYFDGVNLKSKGQYVDGKMDGRIAYFYPNGTEVAAGFYKNGMKNGPWIYRTESGKVREKELYKDGKLAGEKETAAFFANTKTLGPQNGAGNAPKTNNPPKPK